MPLALFTPSFGFNQKLNTFFCTILRVHYYHGRNIGPNQVLFPSLLDDAKLNELASFFIMMSNVVVAMKPPTNCNPCSKMWALLASN